MSLMGHGRTLLKPTSSRNRTIRSPPFIVLSLTQQLLRSLVVVTSRTPEPDTPNRCRPPTPIIDTIITNPYLSRINELMLRVKAAGVRTACSEARGQSTFGANKSSFRSVVPLSPALFDGFCCVFSLFCRALREKSPHRPVAVTSLFEI